jgi:outer membrane protein assembly factor BamB
LRAGYRGVNVSGTGPIAADGVLFYGTSLGVVAAVEADDGECLFAYRTARRVPEGIPGARSSDAFAGPLGFAILPSDSSFLYEFARPDPGSPRPDSVLLHPPASVPDALRFAGRNDRRQVFLVASGRDETAAALDTGRGGRIESAPLGPDESFVFRGDRLHERFVRAPALASGKLFAASDRYLYALDLRRDLLLEGATHPPLDPATGLFEDGKVVFGHLLAVPGGILSVTPSAVVLFRDPAR